MQDTPLVCKEAAGLCATCLIGCWAQFCAVGLRYSCICTSHHRAQSLATYGKQAHVWQFCVHMQKHAELTCMQVPASSCPNTQLPGKAACSCPAAWL